MCEQLTGVCTSSTTEQISIEDKVPQECLQEWKISYLDPAFSLVFLPADYAQLLLGVNCWSELVAFLSKFLVTSEINSAKDKDNWVFWSLSNLGSGATVICSQLQI